MFQIVAIEGLCFAQLWRCCGLRELYAVRFAKSAITLFRMRMEIRSRRAAQGLSDWFLRSKEHNTHVFVLCNTIHILKTQCFGEYQKKQMALGDIVDYPSEEGFTNGCT